MKKLRAYMVYAGNPEDGAVLAWAYNRQQARKLSRTVSWMDYDWIDIRAQWLRNCTHEPRSNEPHVYQPPVCESCNLWYGAPLVDELCENCYEMVHSEAAG